jgi:hypothetical protein
MMPYEVSSCLNMHFIQWYSYPHADEPLVLKKGKHASPDGDLCERRHRDKSRLHHLLLIFKRFKHSS